MIPYIPSLRSIKEQNEEKEFPPNFKCSCMTFFLRFSQNINKWIKQVLKTDQLIFFSFYVFKQWKKRIKDFLGFISISKSKTINYKFQKTQHSISNLHVRTSCKFWHNYHTHPHTYRKPSLQLPFYHAHYPKAASIDTPKLESFRTEYSGTSRVFHKILWNFIQSTMYKKK